MDTPGTLRTRIYHCTTLEQYYGYWKDKFLMRLFFRGSIASRPGKNRLGPRSTKKTLAVREALFGRECVVVCYCGCRPIAGSHDKDSDQAVPLSDASVLALTFL
jgi:hypothetical protein